MTRFFRATFKWERFEDGKWEKHIWSMKSHQSSDSWSMESTFDSINELKQRTQYYIDDIKERYGEKARFVSVEVTQYDTATNIFNSVDAIEEIGEE